MGLPNILQFLCTPVSPDFGQEMLKRVQFQDTESILLPKCLVVRHLETVLLLSCKLMFFDECQAAENPRRLGIKKSSW